MKTIIRPNQEDRQTFITFVIDWSEPGANELVTKLVNGFCVEGNCEVQ